MKRCHITTNTHSPEFSLPLEILQDIFRLFVFFFFFFVAMFIRFFFPVTIVTHGDEQKKAGGGMPGDSRLCACRAAGAAPDAMEVYAAPPHLPSIVLRWLIHDIRLMPV